MNLYTVTIDRTDYERVAALYQLDIQIEAESEEDLKQKLADGDYDVLEYNTLDTEPYETESSELHLDTLHIESVEPVPQPFGEVEQEFLRGFGVEVEEAPSDYISPCQFP